MYKHAKESHKSRRNADGFPYEKIIWLTGNVPVKGRGKENILAKFGFERENECGPSSDKSYRNIWQDIRRTKKTGESLDSELMVIQKIQI